ncbi:hypothetical protein C5F49_04190 [Nitrosopumilus oxyclinae]|uniref:Uncharacterized protein n=1 Tax=Nitrosopumilus oxyclinae TaxID=1959104 RepID=A0A7D5R362_9ARCH|nr:hypothetical protein [Nitrosopumilus oxyclinae]QLH04598.1 hypothetical protein C5F49_04190 [Nitrosopumilus oxyclinae]
MSIIDKFQNTLHCMCKEDVIFEIIDDVECDWGIHTVIQCPKCEELFSIDCGCPAFQDVMKLTLLNQNLFSDEQNSNYLKNSHPN